MHIQDAKNQIKNAVLAYSARDPYGHLRIPVNKQRPVFLVGAPGIGKTAIVEQIAQELDLAYVSYSMTHHTRQSALGLPYITEKQYGGETYSVSEYTMSEILSSVYDEMEKTGRKQGILFLDEINCVSETLAPSMLQFLQYKTFGRHRVPDGWIVVTAGNPPEYNDAVREYDIAMLDRLKKIEVEPDYEVWKNFAAETGIHPVILSYLSIRPNHFYKVQATVDGKSFVTARSWDDLGQMITLYEEMGIPVDNKLIPQYIQDEEIARDFANYYDLYRKYQSDYRLPEILAGRAPQEIVERAKNAPFDERLSLISLIISSLTDTLGNLMIREDAMRRVLLDVKGKDIDPDLLDELIEQYNAESEKTGTAAEVETASEAGLIAESLVMEADPKDALRTMIADLKEDMESGSAVLDNVFTFFEDCFTGKSQEMLILVSELTVRKLVSRFIYSHGCEKYQMYNEQLLFEKTGSAIDERIDALHLLEIEEE